MELVRPSWEIMTPLSSDDIYGRIEAAGRTCYKSEDKITPGSSRIFVKMLVKRGHHSVLEHIGMSVRFVVDRGVSHELVRHRLAAFSQESTRYCNYRGGVSFVIPPWVEAFEPTEGRMSFGPHVKQAEKEWCLSMQAAEKSYLALLDAGWTPQQARAVLPNSLKTEVVVTANMREWRHILNIRVGPNVHPQMNEVMAPLLKKMKQTLPVLFEDIHAS